MDFDPRQHDRMHQVWADYSARSAREIASTMPPPPRRARIQLQHVDGWDPNDGFLQIPVLREMDERGTPYFRPLAKFVPQYGGGWQQRTIYALFGGEQLMIWPSENEYREWQSLKVREREEQSRACAAVGELIPATAYCKLIRERKKQPFGSRQSVNNPRSAMLDQGKDTSIARDSATDLSYGFHFSSNHQTTVQSSQARVEELNRPAQRPNKRKASERELEDGQNAKRARRSGSASIEKSTPQPSSIRISAEADAAAQRLAEEEFQVSQRRTQRCVEEFIRSTPFYSVEDLWRASIGQPPINGRRLEPANYRPKRGTLQENAKAAWKIANGEEAEIIDPWRERPGVHVEEWLPLFAPEAMPILFPLMFVRRDMLPNIGQEPLPPELTHGVDFTGGVADEVDGVIQLHNNVHGMTNMPCTEQTKETSHLPGDMTKPEDNTYGLPSASPMPNHRADLNHYNISLEKPWLQSNNSAVTTPSENHRTERGSGIAAEMENNNQASEPPREPDATSSDPPLLSRIDPDLEQVQRRIAEAENMDEAACRELDLTPEQLIEFLRRFVAQRWQEGTCLPSCRDECGCLQQWNPQSSRFATLFSRYVR